MSEITLQGIPASPGIAIGKVYLFYGEELVVVKRQITEKQVAEEVKRFKKSLAGTRTEIFQIKKKILEEIGVEQAQIFSAHLLVLEDATLIEEVVNHLKKELLCVEYIFSEVLKKYVNALSKTDDEYLRERVSDINDVGKRVLRNLLGAKRNILETLTEKVIIVAYDLSPSDTATMHRGHVLAFATDIGGRTSHTAIMAKSLEIPAVVGLEVITGKVKNGDTLIIDGTHGKAIINPDRETIEKYQSSKQRFEAFERDLNVLKDMPSQTIDGRRITLAANIELPEEAPSVMAHGAEGIGLYRTEFFYMNRQGLPTEEEHYNSYKDIAQRCDPKPVIIRTLDLGGDKFLSHLNVPHEMNPFLGWRAIRFCLARPDIFKTQLRAILRASVHGNLSMMYPMISCIEELRQANLLVDEVKKELEKEGVPFNRDIKIGTMIEVPSAALVSDVLAKETDFFSIGTNDLIQYALAIDRVNEKIAYLYEPAHPAVLRLVKTIIDNGHKENIWVGMCGEMAGDVVLTLILVGLGLDEFSMSPILLPEIKRIVRAVTYEQAKDIAEKAMSLSSGADIERFAREKLRELVPDVAMEELE